MLESEAEAAEEEEEEEDEEEAAAEEGEGEAAGRADASDCFESKSGTGVAVARAAEVDRRGLLRADGVSEAASDGSVAPDPAADVRPLEARRFRAALVGVVAEEGAVGEAPVVVASEAVAMAAPAFFARARDLVAVGAGKASAECSKRGGEGNV